MQFSNPNWRVGASQMETEEGGRQPGRWAGRGLTTEKRLNLCEDACVVDETTKRETSKCTD